MPSIRRPLKIQLFPVTNDKAAPTASNPPPLKTMLKTNAVVPLEKIYGKTGIIAPPTH